MKNNSYIESTLMLLDTYRKRNENGKDYALFQPRFLSYGINQTNDLVRKAACGTLNKNCIEDRLNFFMNILTSE